MTEQKRTETTHSETAARRKAGATASPRRGPPRPLGPRAAAAEQAARRRRGRSAPLRRAAGPTALGAAAAAVLVAALAAAALPAYAAGPWQGSGGMVPDSAAANADADADAAYPSDAAPAAYEPVCGHAYGGHPDGAAATPSPAQVANMTSRIEALHAEYDAILAEYGFVYREPANLTGAQTDRIEAEMGRMMARYDGMLAEVEGLARQPYAGMLGLPFDGPFGPHATLAAVYQLIDDEHDDILRRHGFVISAPQLSDADDRRLSERLDAVVDRMDRVYERCTGEPPAPAGAGGGDEAAGHAHGASPYGLAPAAGPRHAEVDDILAEYGFVYREPANLTTAQLEQLDARTARLFDRHADAVEDLVGRLAPMLANGSIAVADAFSEDKRLADRANAEHNAILAEFGYVIVTPDLSAKDREAMIKRLASAYARIDSALEGAYQAYGAGAGGGGGASGGGGGGQAGTGSAADSGPPGPPARLPDSGGITVYDAFDGDERRAAQAGAGHEASAAGYDYLTASRETPLGDGTLVVEDLADIYAGIDVAPGDYSETYGSAADNGGGDSGGGGADAAATAAHRSS